MELKKNSENSLEDKNGGITGVILVIVSVVGIIAGGIIIWVGDLLSFIVLGWLILIAGYLIAGISGLIGIIGIIMFIMEILRNIVKRLATTPGSMYVYLNNLYTSLNNSLLRMSRFSEKIRARLFVTWAMDNYEKLEPNVLYTMVHKMKPIDMSPPEYMTKNNQIWSCIIPKDEAFEFNYGCYVCNDSFVVKAPSYRKLTKILKKKAMYNILFIFLSIPLAFFDLYQNGQFTYSLIDYIANIFLGIPLISFLLSYPFNRIWKRKHPILAIENLDHMVGKETLTILPDKN